MKQVKLQTNVCGPQIEALVPRGQRVSGASGRPQGLGHSQPHGHRRGQEPSITVHAARIPISHHPISPPSVLPPKYILNLFTSYHFLIINFLNHCTGSFVTILKFCSRQSFCSLRGLLSTSVIMVLFCLKPFSDCLGPKQYQAYIYCKTLPRIRLVLHPPPLLWQRCCSTDHRDGHVDLYLVELGKPLSLATVIGSRVGT